MTAEKEIIRLFRGILKGSRFAGKAFAVGGFVRDQLMGIESKDLDIVVGMKGGADDMSAFIHGLFRDEVTTPHRIGASYPIFQITFKDDVEVDGEVFRTAGGVVELADSQKEAFPDPDSRQRVTTPGTIEEDILRRDLTINMLLRDLVTGEIVDHSGVGEQDIIDGVLRGHPEVDFAKIISDDPLRMLRLVRFRAKFGFRIPMDVLNTVVENAHRIEIISGERIRTELEKIMELGKLHQAISMMDKVGLLEHVLPEIHAMHGVEHDTSRGHHLEGDVFVHTMLVLEHAKPGVVNQLAALLHDVGKPATQEILPDKIMFLKHEDVGGEIAEEIMRRLKFDGEMIRRIRLIVENHMRPHMLVRNDVSVKAFRRFVRAVGDELDAVLDLAEADSFGNLPVVNLVPELRENIVKAMSIPDRVKPILGGRDIMEILGIEPGPMIGEAMAFLKDKEDEFAENGDVLTEDDAKRVLVEDFA